MLPAVSTDAVAVAPLFKRSEPPFTVPRELPNPVTVRLPPLRPEPSATDPAVTLAPLIWLVPVSDPATVTEPVERLPEIAAFEAKLVEPVPVRDPRLTVPVVDVNETVSELVNVPKLAETVAMFAVPALTVRSLPESSEPVTFNVPPFTVVPPVY
jgi:hypothetical protein